MKRAVLITGHYWGSQRWAGFHWIAHALASRGWKVLFLTASLSHLSRLRRDYRLSYPIRNEAGRIRRFTDNIDSFVWHTPWHPANLRWSLLNWASRSIFQRYGDLPLGDAEPIISQAELFMFESTPGLLLFDRLRSLNPQAATIYRVSDDLHLLKNHPVVIEQEARIAALFDLVSVPSRYILTKFAGFRNARLQPHGIEKEVFDRDYPDPYTTHVGRNLVFVGNSRCDRDFLARASELCPEWHFHIIGPIRRSPVRPNINTYGELPFEATVPYIKHADIGLHTLEFAPGAESFTDSLKVIQYTYCGLPIVAPDFLASERPNKFYYRPGDNNSIASALHAAAMYVRSLPTDIEVWSWTELVSDMLEEAGVRQSTSC